MFVFGCVPARILIAGAVLNMPPRLQIKATASLAAIGICFATLYYFELRMNAPEGGGTTWWHRIRPLHSLTYLLAASLLVAGKEWYASTVLIVDVTIGLCAWMRKNSFQSRFPRNI